MPRSIKDAITQCWQGIAPDAIDAVESVGEEMDLDSAVESVYCVFDFQMDTMSPEDLVTWRAMSFADREKEIRQALRPYF